MKLILLTPVICSALSLVGGCGTPGKSTGLPQGKPVKSPTLSVPLDVSEVPLADLTAEDLPLLKRHLAISSAWKLTREGSNLVAIRREKADESTPEAGKLRMTPDGFYFKHQPWRRYRVRLAIGGAPAAPDREWQPIRVDAVRGRRNAVLKVQPVEHPDHRSYLVVAGENNLFLEILEESMDTSRESTRRLLHEASAELEKVLEYSPDGKPTPRLEGLTPAGSTSTAAPVMRLERVTRSNGFHVFGYVNPGVEGTVFLRLFDPGGTEIAPARVREQTLEYVGWSPNPGIRYFFNSRLDYGSDPTLPSRAELWFQPESGGTVRKLLQTRLK